MQKTSSYRFFSEISGEVPGQIIFEITKN